MEEVCQGQEEDEWCVLMCSLLCLCVDDVSLCNKEVCVRTWGGMVKESCVLVYI